MKVYPIGKTPDEKAGRVLSKVEYWEFTIVPSQLSLPDNHDLADYQIGCSRDGKAWALVGTVKNKKRYDPLAVLTDPPERHSDSIAEILMRVWIASRENVQLSSERIDDICNQVTFPHYRTVAENFPDAPEDWLHLPSEFVVNIDLSEGACINAEMHMSFERECLTDVLKTVCGPRVTGYLLTYSLVARKVVPLLRWNVDWPLSRRGKNAPWKRGKVQGTFPWEAKSDPSLISIYQDVRMVGAWPAPCYWSEPTVRLVVGGRTREGAVSNWHRCAKALRKLRRELT